MPGSGNGAGADRSHHSADSLPTMGLQCFYWRPSLRSVIVKNNRRGSIGMRLWYLGAVAVAPLISDCDREAEKRTEQVGVSAEFSSKADAKPASASTYEESQVTQEEAARDNLTPSQANAARSAEQYLNMTGFSRDGLIEQLSSDAGDGYSVADSIAAVDSLTVDWNENAARSAKQYLDLSGFSCKGLIEQLSSHAGDKYTVAQATYGAHQAGAC